MYFTNFPNTYYQISPPSRNKAPVYVNLIDITTNVRFKKEILDNIVAYDYYLMRESDTIEIVSEKLYGSPYYHWLLMLFNDRYDYLNDFAMSGSVFEEYIKKKYPSDYLESEYGTNPRGLIVDIVNEDGISVDIDGTVNIRHNSTGTVTQVPIISSTKYDETLGLETKRFINTSTNQYVDVINYTIDFGAIPAASPVMAYDKEYEENESKRKLKVISKKLLPIVLDNFRNVL